MADIARLGIQIDVASVPRAVTQLGKLSKQADMLESSLTRLQASLQGLERSIGGSLQQKLQSLSTVVLALSTDTKQLASGAVSANKLSKSLERLGDSHAKLGVISTELKKIGGANIGTQATTNLDELRRSIGYTKNSITQLGKSLENAPQTNMFSSLRVGALGLAVAIAGTLATTKELAAYTLKTADDMTRLSGVFTSLTGSTKEANAAIQQIYQNSQLLGVNFEDAAKGMQGATLVLQDLGLSTKDAINFSTLFIKMMRDSGASTDDASESLRQYMQAMGSSLKGDELRVLSERAPALMRNLAKELGVTTGELKKLGSEGKITSDIMFKAITNNQDKIINGGEKMSQTFEAAANRFGNASKLFVSSADDVAGFSAMATQSTNLLASTLEEVTKALFNTSGAASDVGSNNGINIFATTAVRVLAHVMDVGYGVVQTFKAVGTGIGALMAAASEAASGNFKGAGSILGQGYKDATALMTKDWAIFSKSAEIAIANMGKTKAKMDAVTGKIKPIKQDAKLTPEQRKAIREAEAEEKRRQELYQKQAEALADSFLKVRDAARQYADSLIDVDTTGFQNKQLIESLKIEASLRKQIADIEANKDLTPAGKEAAMQEAVKYAGNSRDIASQFKSGNDAATLQSNEDTRYQLELEAIKKFFADKHSLTAEMHTQLETAERAHQERLGQIARSATEQKLGEMQFMVGSATQIVGDLSNFLQQAGKENTAFAKAAFISQKALAIANAVIQTELAATKALAEGGTVMGIPMATAIRAVGYASVGIMSATSAMEASQKFAKGGAFSGGSVVDTPTYFPMSGGKTGLMGEAGPEVILPLSKGKDGSLGVRVQGSGGSGGGVTINQGGINVTVQGNVDSPERLKALEKMIRSVSNDSILQATRQGGLLNRR